MSYLQRLAATLAAVAMLIVGLSACDSSNTQAQPVVYYTPTVWGPYWHGVHYCGYLYTPLECAGHPGTPYQMPMLQPAYGTLSYELFLFHLQYHAYYDSGYYYDNVLMSPRVKSHVMVTRTQYVVVVNKFGTSYKSGISQYSAKATYKGSNGSKMTGKQASKVFTGGNANPRSGGNGSVVQDPGKQQRGNGSVVQQPTRKKAGSGTITHHKASSSSHRR